MDHFGRNRLATGPNSVPVGFGVRDMNYSSPRQVRPKPSQPGWEFPASYGQGELSALETRPASFHQRLRRELEQSECHIKRLQTYWAAVADDLGPAEWQNPANAYRRIWEAEIDLASKRHEYLLSQVGPVLGPKNHTQLDIIPAYSCTVRKMQNSGGVERVGNRKTQKKSAQRKRAKARKAKAEVWGVNGFEFRSNARKLVEGRLSPFRVKVLRKDESRKKSEKQEYLYRKEYSEDKENGQLGLSPSADYTNPFNIIGDLAVVNHGSYTKELSSGPGFNEVSAHDVFTHKLKNPFSADTNAICDWRKAKSECQESRVLREISVYSDRKTCSSSQTFDDGSSVSSYVMEEITAPKVYDGHAMSYGLEKKTFPSCSDLDSTIPRASTVVENHRLGLSDVHMTALSDDQFTKSPSHEFDVGGGRLVGTESLLARARPIAADFMSGSDTPAQTSDRQFQTNNGRSPSRRSSACGAKSPGPDAVYLSSPRIISTPPGPQDTTLRIDNVPGIDANDLQNLFHGYDIASISIPYDPHQNRDASHGFVTLWETAAACRAVAQLSGREIRGREITVQLGNAEGE